MSAVTEFFTVALVGGLILVLFVAADWCLFTTARAFALVGTLLTQGAAAGASTFNGALTRCGAWVVRRSRFPMVAVRRLSIGPSEN